MVTRFFLPTVDALQTPYYLLIETAAGSISLVKDRLRKSVQYLDHFKVIINLMLLIYKLALKKASLQTFCFLAPSSNRNMATHFILVAISFHLAYF